MSLRQVDLGKCDESLVVLQSGQLDDKLDEETQNDAFFISRLFVRPDGHGSLCS